MELQQVDRYGDSLPDGAIGRIGTLRLRHSMQCANGWIKAAAFNSAGTLLAIAAREDARISVWEIPSGRLRYMLHAHQHGHVLSAEFSPDGRWLVSQGWGGPCAEAIGLWDMADGKRLDWLPSNAGSSPNFSPDGQFLATADREGIALWDVLNKQFVRRVEPTAAWPVFASSGELLIGANDQAIYMWQAPTGDLKGRFEFEAVDECQKSHCSGVVSANGCWLAASRAIVTISDGRISKTITEIVVWDVSTGSTTARIRTTGEAQRLVFLPDTPVLLSSHDAKQNAHCLCAWNILTAERSWRIRLNFRAEFVLSLTSRYIACISDNSEVAIHDVSTGRKLKAIPALPTLRGIDKLAYNPVQENVLAIAHYDGLIELRDTETGNEIDHRVRHTDEIRTFVFSNNGARIATQSPNTAMLWDTLTGHERAQIEIPYTDRNLVGTSEQFVVLAPKPGQMSVWSWASGKPWPHLPESFDGRATLWPGRDLLTVQMAAQDNSQLRSTVTGNVVGELPGTISTISPDGSLFVIIEGESRFSVWQLEPLREVARIEIPIESLDGEPLYHAQDEDSAHALAISPDGANVACRVRHVSQWHARHGVLHWDVATGSLVSQAHLTVANPMEWGCVPILGFRADGIPLLATPTYTVRDNREHYSVILWNGATGAHIGTFMDGPDVIEAMAFSPQGSTLGITRDTSVLLWGLQAKQ